MDRRNSIFILLLTAAISLTCPLNAKSEVPSELNDLRNYRVNSATLVSAGLPEEKHFRTLKAMGVNKVIDLIPGDRSEEANLVNTLDMSYHNVQVDWQNPTLTNFIEYVGYMQQSTDSEGITLTHCQLNWRGAVFTYLYKVTQLGESEPDARAEMHDVWKPNRTWQRFIDEVKAHYQAN